MDAQIGTYIGAFISIRLPQRKRYIYNLTYTTINWAIVNKYGVSKFNIDHSKLDNS